MHQKAMLVITLSFMLIAVPLISSRLSWSKDAISPVTLGRASSVTFFFAAALSLNILYVSTLGSGVSPYSASESPDTVSMAIECFIFVVGGLIILYVKLPALDKPLIIKCPTSFLGLLAAATFLVSNTVVLALYLAIELSYTFGCAILIYRGKPVPFTKPLFIKLDMGSVIKNFLFKFLIVKIKFVLGGVFLCLIFAHSWTICNFFENCFSLRIINQRLLAEAFSNYHLFYDGDELLRNYNTNFNMMALLESLPNSGKIILLVETMVQGTEYKLFCLIDKMKHPTSYEFFLYGPKGVHHLVTYNVTSWHVTMPPYFPSDNVHDRVYLLRYIFNQDKLADPNDFWAINHLLMQILNQPEFRGITNCSGSPNALDLVTIKTLIAFVATLSFSSVVLGVLALKWLEKYGPEARKVYKLLIKFLENYR